MLHVLRRAMAIGAVALFVPLLSRHTAAQESPAATAAAEPKVDKPELRTELLARMAKDQEARLQLMELMKPQPGVGRPATSRVPIVRIVTPGPSRVCASGCVSSRTRRSRRMRA